MRPILLLTALTALNLAAQTKTIDIRTASIADIQSAVAAGALTYEGLTRLYLNRIAAYDKQGPRLNAIIHINPQALETARALDAERRAKGVRGPLHGIPVAIKDNIDTVGMPTTGGTPTLAGAAPSADAHVIRKLRDAGAIIIVKTNMDELAAGSAGLSSVGGQTLNPYDLSRGPGGSSGGTAVAVNAAFATVGLGTETGVSVRDPATNNALIGIVPTRGLVSRAGVIPLSFTQDRVGVHAKSVADAAAVLAVIQGLDPADLFTQASLGNTSRSFDRPSTLAGIRIGVLRDLFRSGEPFAPQNRLVENQFATLTKHGAIVLDGLRTGIDLIALIPSARVNYIEIRAAMDAYLARRSPVPPVKTLAELAAAKKHLPSLEERIAKAPTLDSLDTNPEYLSRLQTQQMLREQLIALMDRYRVDALIYPSKGLTAPPIGTVESGLRDNPFSAVTGLPAVVVPAGYAPDGLPVAIEFLSRPFTEQKLIGIAAAYEQATRFRVPPKTTPGLPGEILSY